VHNASTYPIEVVAATAPGRTWSQLYMPRDRDVAAAILDRNRRAGIDVLCVTTDSPVAGNRERNYRNRLTSPTVLVPERARLAREAIRNPRWAFQYLAGRRRARRLLTEERPVHQDHAHATAVTPADIAWLRSQWPGRLVIKGVQRGDEAERLVELGVDGLIVSNHGGRHLDTARASIAALPEVVDAASARAEVFLDSGVRRGTDVIKALALGARAVLIGRPYVFGLAVGGEAGVSRVLEIFRSELAQSMALAGSASVDQIDRTLVGLAALRERVPVGPGYERPGPTDVASERAVVGRRPSLSGRAGGWPVGSQRGAGPR
jgi:isopentenyl diphosphate isomerase/L-lactate dehydrogenase-like FMN-dependent dehydrogenase